MNLSGQINTINENQDTLNFRTKGLPVSYKIKSLQKPDSVKTDKSFKKIDGTGDSLKSKYAKINSDSLKNEKKPSLSFTKDSTDKYKILEKIKKTIPRGNVSVGYDYGFLPYTVNMPSPSSAAKTEGLLETDILGLPVDVSFFYSTQKNLIGLNNYFRISYNAERYKEKLNTKLYGKIDSYKNNLNRLNSQKQQVLQKMAYSDYLSSIEPDKWPIDRPDIHLQNSDLDTSGMMSGLQKPDTTGLIKAIGDSSGITKYTTKADSARQRALLYKHKKDSVAEAYENYKRKYDQLNDSVKKVQNKISELKGLLEQNPSYSKKSPYLNKVQNVLSGVKKMDIGLCYPAYSTFLANNIPVRGINFEYEKDKRFFAFTYGTTVSTLLSTNRNIEGFLQNVRNAYNYFDVNNLEAGRKILAMKFGIGEKEGDHFFAGFLIGKGSTTFLSREREGSVSGAGESNLVVEADIRKKLFKKTVLDILIGKSSLQHEDLEMSTIRLAAREVFSNFHSYAALVRLKTYVAVTKSSLSFSVRWVDPFFSSYGIGFMRSDNLRYEVKLEQAISKSIKYTGMFRHEEDNLLQLLNYKNTFLSVNNTLSYKIKKGLVVRVGYTPLIRNLNGENYQMNSKSSITTGILSFTPKGKVQKQFNFLYNNYHVDTDSAAINFQNFAYYHQFTFKRGFKTGLNVSWFKNNLRDSSANDVYLLVLDAGYQFKNGSVLSVAGKSAYKPNGEFYPGFIVKANVRLSKLFYWENQVEKFIVGDLFNGYDLENLQRFPYCFTTKLILNF